MGFDGAELQRRKQQAARILARAEKRKAETKNEPTSEADTIEIEPPEPPPTKEESQSSMLTTCRACSKQISINATSCPRCGEPSLTSRVTSTPSSDQSPSYPNTILIKQGLGLIGSVALFIGVFTPIISIPIAGNMNYFQNGKGDGSIILVLAGISLIAVFMKEFRALLGTGVVSLGVLLFTLVQFQLKMDEVKSEMDADLAGNPFRGLADMAVQSIQLQWGWAVLVVGAALLIGSGTFRHNQV